MAYINLLLTDSPWDDLYGYWVIFTYSYSKTVGEKKKGGGTICKQKWDCPITIAFLCSNLYRWGGNPDALLNLNCDH